MPSPSDSTSATSPSPQRPSLLGAAAPAKAGAQLHQDADPSGFGVSILSAIDKGQRTKRALPPKPATARKSNRAWWLGIAVAAAALLGAAQWQRSQSEAQQPVTTQAANSTDKNPTKVAQAGVNAAEQPAPPVVVAIEPRATPNALTVAAAAPPSPASSPFSALSLADPATTSQTTPTSSATTPPLSARLSPTASPSTAERKPSTARGTNARTPVALAQKPAAAKPAASKDADAELLAALMVHSDGSKETAKTKPAAPRALTEAERRRFANKLRDCRSKGSASTQDDCRLAACQAVNYWGRTKSCPAGGANALPQRAAAN